MRRRAFMGEPQLSVRSARARDLAHRLARREHRSIADIVERALEAYEIREAGREPAATFYARLADEYSSDIDLEVLIRENRKIDPGPEL
ncbi:MAG: type II toxin-antitoxin system VapB family antitoxin [Acetobacteraceae bacterium]